MTWLTRTMTHPRASRLTTGLVGLVLLVVAVVTIVGGLPGRGGAIVFAHHGLAEFDQSKPVTLTGTVTVFRFVNPHAIIEFDVKDEAGQVRGWKAELTTPRRLKGWTATSLEPGDGVTITGYRAKSGSPYLWVLSLRSPKGLDLASVPQER